MITNYQKQWNFLKNKFEAGQLGHAYLLSGLEQTGKEFFAKEFIKFINCLSQRIDGRQFFEMDKKLCGECQNCKMIEKGVFPDLLIIKSKNSESSIKNEKDMMNVEVDQIREAQNFLSYKSYYSGFKTVIIDNAERMTFEAQNCFLKNLEEPRGKTIIFLISSKLDMLLPTITSRCQEIKFFQVKKYEFSKDEQEILQDLLAVLKSDLAVKFQYAKKINLEEGSLNKILEILQRHLRNLLLSKIGVVSGGQTVENGDFSIKQLEKAIKLIDKINHQSNIANINNKLALEVLLMEL